MDKVRSLTAHDLSTGEMLFRLTSLEEPNLSCTAEGEEITDAIGATIATLYRAKKATFSATNSLISLDLAAAQYGTKKDIGSETNKIKVPTYEVLTVDNGTVELAHTPVGEISYIYSIVNGEIATAYKAGATVSATEFVVGEKEVTKDGETVTVPSITVPTGVTGKIYVEYAYETENANRIVNSTANFPEACSMKIFAYFRDKCNENMVYSGVIVSPKAKLNPESVELALTSTGKHPFEFKFQKDYCSEEEELFSIIISQ